MVNTTLLTINKFYYIIWCAVQNLAQSFKCKCGYSFVVFQIVYGSRVYFIVVYQAVCSNALRIHGFPKWFIAYHNFQPFCQNYDLPKSD